jgi:hypothetical protein|tara:strand:+ start:2347 stop:3147 length:801 start_codon:yes stop_codon:yes gene_type:complete
MAFKMNPGRGPMQKTGRGIPQAFQSPLNQAKKKDVMSGDQLPSYTRNTTTSDNSASGSGSSTKSMTQSKESSKGKGKKLPTYKETYGDAEKKKYGSLEAYSAAGDAYNAKKQQAKSDSSSVADRVMDKKKQSSSTSSTTKSKTTSIGNQTKNQVKAKGIEDKGNAVDKRKAEKQAAIIRAKSDSTKVSNEGRKRVTRDGKLPLNKVTAKKITARANAKGRSSLRGSLGKDGATKAFPTYKTSKNVKNTIQERSGTEGGVFTGEDFD